MVFENSALKKWIPDKQMLICTRWDAKKVNSEHKRTKINEFPEITAKKKLKFPILVNSGQKNAKMHRPDIWKTVENNRKHRKTPKNTRKQQKTPTNTNKNNGKHQKNTRKHKKTPENTRKHTKTPIITKQKHRNAQKHQYFLTELSILVQNCLF